MSVARKVISNTLAVALVGGVGFFFYRSFRDNWDKLQAADFKPDYLALFAATLAIGVTILLSTCGWHVAINDLSKRNKLTFAQSVSTVNTSGLTKYIPGKVWSYAIQMHWLSDAGIGKGLVLFANLANLAASLITSGLAGLLCLGLALSPGRERQLVLGSFALAGSAYALALVFHQRPLRWFALLLGKLLKRPVEQFSFSGRGLALLQAAHIAAAVLEGIGTYWTCYGMGYHSSFNEGLTIAASALLGSVIGFLAVFVPGGLGVREGVMWWVLKSNTPAQVALTLPIVSRVLSMFGDVALGAVALFLLTRIQRARRAT